MSLKISFIVSDANDSLGSYRIWVRDLSKTLKELGHDIVVHSPNCNSNIEKGLLSIVKMNGNTIHDEYFQNFNDSDVLILGKCSYKNAGYIRKIFPNKVIGAINPPCDYYDEAIDFLIVGSPEEYCSLGFYENIFMYPLIEREFENIKIKKHKQQDDDRKLRICFHGHYPHLFKFEPFLKDAINEIAKSTPVELNIITGDPEYLWHAGRPGENVSIVMHKYDLKTISNLILKNDIGVVPNVSDIRLFVNEIATITSSDYGLYNTDYFLRFKNKTNGGRAYVFYQHGIPVIHDLSPSNFLFMGLTGEVSCAHDKHSWIKEIKKLSNYKERNRLAKINYDVFKREYSPHKYGKLFIEFLNSLKIGK